MTSSGLETFFGSQEAIKVFEKLEDDAERVAFVRSLPYVQTLLKAGWDQSSAKSAKSVSEATRLKNLGNQAFKKGDMNKALHFYNEAFIFAPFPSQIQNEHEAETEVTLAQQQRPDDSQEATGFPSGLEVDSLLVVALANRSAALVRLERCSEALADINLALNIGGHSKPAKLLERKLRCCINLGLKEEAKEALVMWESASADTPALNEIKELMSNSNQSSSNNEVSVPALLTLSKFHKNVPCLSEAVEIKYEAARGRFGVAKRDIEAGEVLIEEEAAASLIKVGQGRTHCTVCLRDCLGVQIPCRHCSSARFCSLKCLSSQSFHRFECDRLVNPLSLVLHQMPGSAVEYAKLSLRAVAQRPLNFFKTNKDLFEQAPDSSSFGVTTSKKSSHDSIFHGYKGLLSLVSHRCSRATAKEGIFWVVVSAAFNLFQLQIRGYFAQVDNPRSFIKKSLNDDELLIAKALVMLLERMQFNTHAVLEQVCPPEAEASPSRWCTRPCGSAIYPTLALLNHACDHNVVKVFDGPRVRVLAARFIQKGEEVTENYFPRFELMTRKRRREWLEMHYRFECLCKACQEDYPLLQDQSKERDTRFRCFHCGLTLTLSPSTSTLTCSNRQCSKRGKAGELHQYQELLQRSLAKLDSIWSKVEQSAAAAAAAANTRPMQLKESEALVQTFSSLSKLIHSPSPHLFEWSQRCDSVLKHVYGLKTAK